MWIHTNVRNGITYTITKNLENGDLWDFLKKKSRNPKKQKWKEIFVKKYPQVIGIAVIGLNWDILSEKWRYGLVMKSTNKKIENRLNPRPLTYTVIMQNITCV